MNIIIYAGLNTPHSISRFVTLIEELISEEWIRILIGSQE
jgi:hypothetical protein